MSASSLSSSLSSSMGGGLVETTPGSLLNDRKQSISNLEKQFAAPLGQRLVVGIQIDAKCLEGGVEAVSKRARQEKQMQLQMNTDNFATPTPHNSITSGSATATEANGMTSIDFNQNAANATTDNGDPFSFLNDAPQQQQPQQQQSQRKFGMGFLKKVAARTQDSLERGMQGLAVRMDQGKNADQVRVAIHDPSTNELLGVTESLPVPGTALNSVNSSNGGKSGDESSKNPDAPKDLRFEVPLWINGSRRKQSLLLKVWIQSGATLVLQKSAKNYLLGSAMVNCQALVEGVTAVALNMTTTPTTLNGIPQQGPPPRLQLCVLQDPKFSPILSRGWSLTDPDMSGYSSTLNYLPLDQSYVFPGKQSNHWLIAHERATESTVPLPIAAAMTELAANACDRSLAHAQSVAKILRNNRHDFKDPAHKATCQLGVLGVIPGPGYAIQPNATKANISVAWRRPDSIFEFEIAANENIPVISPNGPTPGGYVSLKRTFYPKLCSPANGDPILPGILQAYGGKLPHIGCFLGGVYFSVTIDTPLANGQNPAAAAASAQAIDIRDPFAPTTTSSGGNNNNTERSGLELWETVLGLEAFVKTESVETSGGATNNNNNARIQTMQVPLRRGSTDVGYLLLQLQVNLPDGAGTSAADAVAATKNYMTTLPATDGLVSLVGMDSLSDGVKPYLDSLPENLQQPPTAQPNSNILRQQQLDTMGYFFTTQYMDQHLALRKSACEAFRDRARSYKYALSQPETNALPHTLKTPKNFRPSSSRMTALLSGIPFNCHVCSLNINVMDAVRPRQPPREGATLPEYPGAAFHNVTCGAPADHARGFGNILTNVSAKKAIGGLRRLEIQRKEYSAQLKQAQSNLIAGIGQYLTEARKTAGAAVHHVPARHAQIQQLRWRVFECVHILHHITWMCAVRRANVFSQSLGLAVSSFLASLSDVHKCAAGWPAVWAKHGFLVCFEGLLSAAGKELGMIEDASVAIAMLRMVSLVMVPAQGNETPPGAVPIPSSPYLKWTRMVAGGGDGKARNFTLTIGVDPAYYEERVPVPLKNNTPVRLFPILFEVGVDIRQWGANTGSNLRKNNQNGNAGNNNQAQQVGSLVDDGDDDDVGIVDDDVLVALNYEAMRKMNCYAHALSPQQIPPAEVIKATERVFVGSNNGIQHDASTATENELPIHPSLATLNSHILSSAGRMNHSILDEAATIAQQLGGGGLVFCKSGKDRTAMHLTYKQCQFAGRYRGNHDQSAILRDASLLRLHGTRLPICEKNVGQALYAFNSLQVKFMPEALKPPMDCLAGFLKGGEIFKGGGIET